MRAILSILLIFQMLLPERGHALDWGAVEIVGDDALTLHARQASKAGWTVEKYKSLVREFGAENYTSGDTVGWDDFNSIDKVWGLERHTLITEYQRGWRSQMIKEAVGERGPPISQVAGPVIGRRIATPAQVAAAGTTLLLDESGLGSAAVAYSVRKLRSAYSGSALRVRRSSDSTEQDIGFSGNDLDTASLASFCSGTDGFVVTWYDQSGNARNATQATASKQPKIVSGGTVLTGANGKPAMQFDGSNDILIVAWSHSQPTTDSVVIKISTYTSVKYITCSYNQDNYIWANRGTSPQMQQYAGAWVSSNSTGSIGSWQLCTVGFNGASSFIQVNANSDTTGNAGAATSAGLDIMGTQVYSSTIHGELSELVRWNSAIGSSDRTTQRSNVNAYFSIY